MFWERGRGDQTRHVVWASYIAGPEELGFYPEGLEMLKVENKKCHVFKEFPV